MVLGFLPWIMFWVCLGNASLRESTIIPAITSIILVSLLVARRDRPQITDVGTLAFFVFAGIFSLFVDGLKWEPWMNGISCWALVLVCLISILSGRPFVRAYAKKDVSAEVAQSAGFRQVTLNLTLVWLAAFVVTAVSTTIPPIIQPGASLRAENHFLIDMFYWVIPAAAFGIAVLISAHSRHGAPTSAPTIKHAARP